MSETLWAKLLPWAQVAAIGVEGRLELTGPVVSFEALDALRSPEALRAAFRVTEDPAYDSPTGAAYLLVFPQTPLMRLDNPAHIPGVDPERAGAGFLRLPDVVPVWWLHLTRVPIGASVWRLDGGEPVGEAAYRGLARGWEGTRGYTPPTPLVGPSAQWQGQRYAAAFTAAGMEIFSSVQAPGLTRIDDGRWHTEIAREQFEQVGVVEITARWHGLPVRVLADDAVRARCLLTDPGDLTALPQRCVEVEPGVWEVLVERSELVDTAGVETMSATGRSVS